jgi:hypothetical protein
MSIRRIGEGYMPKSWEDLGNGLWKLTVTSVEGIQPQVYRGTKDQITDMLADSNANATKRINELKQSSNGNGQPQTRPMTAAERMQVVADIGDPATVDKAITRVIESTLGPVESLRQSAENAPAEREERHTRLAVETAESFTEETPDWYPSEFNKNALVNFMRTQGMSPINRDHYTQAFEELRAAGLLQRKPEEDDENPESEESQQPERTAPTQTASPKTPTRISTGIRSSDVSGERPRPTTRLKYSREQLANMGKAQYKTLMQTDGAELARCEDYYAKHPARRAG